MSICTPLQDSADMQGEEAHTEMPTSGAAQELGEPTSGAAGAAAGAAQELDDEAYEKFVGEALEASEPETIMEEAQVPETIMDTAQEPEEEPSMKVDGGSEGEEELDRVLGARSRGPSPRRRRSRGPSPRPFQRARTREVIDPVFGNVPADDGKGTISTSDTISTPDMRNDVARLHNSMTKFLVESVAAQARRGPGAGRVSRRRLNDASESSGG